MLGAGVSEAQELAWEIQDELTAYEDVGSEECSVVIRYAAYEEPTGYCENSREFGSKFCSAHINDEEWY